MKKTYNISLNAETVEELRSKHGFKLSEDITNMLDDKLKQLNNIKEKENIVSMDTPAWYNNISLKNYQDIIRKPSMYLRYFRDLYGEFDTAQLIIFLENKYSKEIQQLG